MRGLGEKRGNSFSFFLVSFVVFGLSTPEFVGEIGWVGIIF